MAARWEESGLTPRSGARRGRYGKEPVHGMQLTASGLSAGQSSGHATVTRGPWRAVVGAWCLSWMTRGSRPRMGMPSGQSRSTICSRRSPVFSVTRGCAGMADGTCWGCCRIRSGRTRGAGGACGRRIAGRDAAAAELLAVGRGRGPGRAGLLRRGADGRPRRRAGGGRDGVPQEGEDVGRRRPHVYGNRRAGRELPGRRVPGLRHPGRQPGADRPGAVPPERRADETAAGRPGWGTAWRS